MSDEAEPAGVQTQADSTEAPTESTPTPAESTTTTEEAARDAHDSGALARFGRRLDEVERRLAEVRGDRRRRWLGVAAGAVVGLALGAVHPLGLLVGGAAVGLPQRDLPRALAAGLGFGILALVAFVLLAPSLDVGDVLAFSPVVYVTVGGALGLGLLGSLARGVV